jgi:two-component system, NarL family, sensor histidine kinase DegS
VTESFPGQLDEILARINKSIAETEAVVADSADELQLLLDSLGRARSRIQGELEQRQLQAMIRPTSDPASGSHSRLGGTAELRQSENVVIEQYADVSTIYRHVVEFGQLLAGSREHLVSTHELPGLDEANELALRQAMIHAQEQERRRLSREIHDGPAQVLANAIIGLEFIERALRQQDADTHSQPIAEIERIRGAMREGLAEIRRFIFDLRPTMLSQRGLIGTVEHYVQTYRHLLPSDTDVSLPGTMPRLTADQELTAFRVIQESLQNIHRHARSSRCWVSIERQSSAVIVKVKDNGRGFDPEIVNTTLAGGSGLLGMRERAEVIGARLAINSTPGEGCEVVLRIPLKSRTARELSLDHVERSSQ